LLKYSLLQVLNNVAVTTTVMHLISKSSRHNEGNILQVFYFKMLLFS